ncbi:Hypothetical protein D9617_6g094680 [Elsinoe fawcettii]|nr:Hypothetical protein D9617_6g094680 [Elsinoe fawcettii]
MSERFPIRSMTLTLELWARAQYDMDRFSSKLAERYLSNCQEEARKRQKGSPTSHSNSWHHLTASRLLVIEEEEAVVIDRRIFLETWFRHLTTAEVARLSDGEYTMGCRLQINHFWNTSKPPSLPMINVFNVKDYTSENVNETIKEIDARNGWDGIPASLESANNMSLGSAILLADEPSDDHETFESLYYDTYETDDASSTISESSTTGTLAPILDRRLKLTGPSGVAILRARAQEAATIVQEWCQQKFEKQLNPKVKRGRYAISQARDEVLQSGAMYVIF